MILDFSKEGATQYSLKCVNQSTMNWYFYIYQRISYQSDNDIYSLVWMASPYMIAPQSYTIFRWAVNYSFFWFDTGNLQTGVIPKSGGCKSASLTTNNYTTFNIEDN